MGRNRARFAAILIGSGLAACGGGGGGAGVAPVPSPPPVAGLTLSITLPSPSPSPSPAGASAAGFACPADPAAADRARETASLPVARAALLAVTYERSAARERAAAFAARERALGAAVVRAFDFSHSGEITRVLAVDPARRDQIAAALRAQAGVLRAGPTGERRYSSAVSVPFWPNAVYFSGFSAAQLAAGARFATPTYHVAPYAENASVPGQWDMHAIGLEYAFGYAAAGNGSGIVNPAALGSAAVQIAIIDTGEDTTHPGLAGKIAYQRCFITDPNGVLSTGTVTSDPSGHGTHIAGLAGAVTGTGFGFIGAGGNTLLAGYRVFPTPDNSCAGALPDIRCGADTQDVAAAITDAVAQHVAIINLSLGGGSCNGGTDSDPVEGGAIANALAAGVIVVAATGNGGGAVTAPGCADGVIAVGASALADGQPNGSQHAGSGEYVPTYSNWGNGNGWGLVAPGGDPATNDTDDLHWIEHIWTSHPYSARFAATSCTTDYPFSAASGGTIDCRTLVAGTSMAAPHVAGAAALIVAVNPRYQSPALMKQLLCATADNIDDAHQGCGRLNAYRALAIALGDPAPP